MGPRAVLIGLILLIALFQCDASEDIVQTQYGPVQGLVGLKDREFLGIPFIAPPVGNLRWAAPQPPRAWGPSVLKATSWGAGCPQFCVLPPFTCPDTTSEDCIHLNIYTPREANLTTLQPVMVFLHGGHFEQGSSGCPLYNASNLVSQSNVIVVTVNYRLGFLGWLAIDQESIAGNFGFLDQVAALQFVQNNIKNFGGDPNQVTLFGQSAGATSIRAHLLSPISKGLFHRVILESDPFTLPMRDLEDASDYGMTFAEKLNCTGSGTLSCLRSQTIENVMAAQKAVADQILILRPLEMFLPWTPVVDHNVIPYHAFDAFRSGKFQKVPMIIGSVSQEGVLFIYKGLNFSLNSLEYEGAIVGVFLEDAVMVTEQYPPIPLFGDKRPELSMLATDYIFECSSRQIAQFAAKNDNPAIYLYQWDHALSWDAWGPRLPFCEGKVCHAAELPYVFSPSVLDKVANLTADERNLRQAIMGYWTNFARTGDPNIGMYKSSLKWPIAMNSASFPRLHFATPASNVVTNLKKEECDMFDSIGYHHGW